MMPFVYLLNGAPVFQPPGGGGNWTVNDLTVTGNETVGGSLTVSGALTAPDLTLGSGGPSVKSSLDARAARQGLVFDGTAGASATLGSNPAGDQSLAFVFDVPASNPSNAFGIFCEGGDYGQANTFACYIGTSGIFILEKFGSSGSNYNGAQVNSFVANYGGKKVHLVVTINSGTLTIYINGVSSAYSTYSGGTPPGWGSSIASTNYYFGKLQSSNYYFQGFLSLVGTYNRALSASEVVSLFEAGTHKAISTTGLLLAPDAAQAGSGLVWTDLSGNGAQIVLPTSGVSWNVPGAGATRVRGTTSTNGNQQLLGAASILANYQILRVRLRSRTGTPTVSVGTSAGGAQIVAAAALSTTWQNMTIVLTGGIISSASSIWIASNSTDVVEVDAEIEPLAF